MQERIPKEYNTKETPSKLQNMLSLQTAAFIERAILGTVIGYTIQKTTGFETTLAENAFRGLLYECIYDLLGVPTAYQIIKNKEIQLINRFSKQKQDICLKDDIGAIPGWMAGIALGHYLAKIF